MVSVKSKIQGLDPQLLLSLERHAVSIAKESGEILIQYFQSDLEVTYKNHGEKNPVSNADLAAETLIVTRIKNTFKDHGILSEETPEPDSLNQDFIWVVDPLDGTTNFINGLPIFASSIGVIYQGIPVVGAIFLPSPKNSKGTVVHAKIGGGAFADDNPISVSNNAVPHPNSVNVLPRSFMRQYELGKELDGKLGGLRKIGSMAYELASVASGFMDYAGFYRPHIWDVAAGSIIVSEAGGNIMAKSSKSWEPFVSFNKTNDQTRSNSKLISWRHNMLASNAAITKLFTNNFHDRISI
ncbi:MAG: myo-inositol-1(or 4)-monophosphatase [Chloroflexi bacterium]|jgi:myo-inositol-1(or 4)-monophosphatase|nr:MAG: myo-inositol-1(or 4)-monophosphatase [Chloroflexota bacterium]